MSHLFSLQLCYSISLWNFPLRPRDRDLKDIVHVLPRDIFLLTNKMIILRICPDLKKDELHIAC